MSSQLVQPDPLEQPIPLRVLLVEDRPSDALLVVRVLVEAGFAPEWQRVDTEPDFLAHLDPGIDVILADYSLPRFSGLEALHLLRDRGLTLPFILLTGAAGEEAVVSALQQGADDYLLKDRLARLGQAVRRALTQHAFREEQRRIEQELRAAERQLLDQERAARAQAEAALRLRDDFLAIASHELRTPITMIKGTAQLLLAEFAEFADAPPSFVSKLLAIDQMSSRLKRLISDLVDVSRLRSGQLTLRVESFDLAHLAEEVVNEQCQLAGGGLPLSLQILGSLPCLVADAQRIQQVLSNVIENAVKYSPAGGDIDIALRAERDGVLVEVRDHGIGLPDGATEHIFEPFGRASNARAAQLPGMGFGLYISRQIVEQHGGTMSAHSRGEGTGMVVSIWLPCTPQRPA